MLQFAECWVQSWNTRLLASQLHQKPERLASGTYDKCIYVQKSDCKDAEMGSSKLIVVEVRRKMGFLGSNCTRNIPL